MNNPSMAGQFGDTTYTKLFVGGLAWETKKETMRNYFEQFGEILEAVVITDKNTGRSKGYGFVTFCEPDAAMRACVDPAPVIDGRRTNCNLASLGVQRSTRPATPQNGARNFRVMKRYNNQGGIEGGMGTAFASAATLPHYAIQQGIPYNIYGYNPYSSEYAYNPMGYYNVYNGAATAQYPIYGGATTSYYPYYHFGQGINVGAGAAGSAQVHAQAQAHGYGVQYPQMFHQYSTMTPTAGLTSFQGQIYGGTVSLVPSSTAQTGLNSAMALTNPSLSSSAGIQYRHIAASTAQDQNLTLT